MTAFALTLVLLSALAHATWNLFTKRVGAGQPFLWLAYVVGAVVYAPIAIGILVVAQPRLGLPALGFVAVATLLQTLYFVLLTAGYRSGDLSLVYPIARGTGPLLATIAAIVVLGERPTPLAIAGGLAVVLGAVALTGDPRALRAQGATRAVLFALATGAVIAAYTLWDKTAVSVLLIPPLFYDWATVVGQAAVASPVAWRRRAEVRETWRRDRTAVLVVGVLSRFAYILVLTALAVSPVSYVAPAREIGILLGAVMGARFLAEGDVARRLSGATAMLAGVVALAVG